MPVRSPVPLPLPTSFGGRDAYVGQLEVQLDSCDPRLFLFPAELEGFCSDAATKRGIDARAWETLSAIEPASGELPAAKGDDIAYLQYSSGSTRFPHGVAVTHERCSTTSTPMASGSKCSRHRPLHLVAALVP